MRKKIRTQDCQEKRHLKCKHHWIIERPQGPTSVGVCKHCGETSDFVNYFSYQHSSDSKEKR